MNGSALRVVTAGGLVGDEKSREEQDEAGQPSYDGTPHVSH